MGDKVRKIGLGFVLLIAALLGFLWFWVSYEPAVDSTAVEVSAKQPVASATGEMQGILASTPYPAQHANPRNSDAVSYNSPVHLKLKWKALEDSSIVQGCTTDRGQIYCALGWSRKSDKCNLVALDERNGETIWEDRVDGRCLLNEYAFINNPTIDDAGNLYIADSERIVSFTSSGRLRWENKLPSQLASRKNLPNVPFGLLLLPDGNLATATLGDGWIILINGETGATIGEPLDLPAEKRPLNQTKSTLLPDRWPDGFMGNLMSPKASQALWNLAFGDSGYETDNNIALSAKHRLLLISSGASFPNKSNSGALWAVSYADKKLEVAFVVELDVEGGIATTPTVSKNQNLVFIGDNDNNLVAVDIEKCLTSSRGGKCSQYTKIPVGNDLTSSVIVTDKDRLIIPLGNKSYAAYDLRHGTNGEVKLDKKWETALASFPIAVSVHMAFDNVVWIPIYHIAKQRSYIVALDINTGEEVARYQSGDAANVTMASDGKTILANNMSFIRTNFLGRFGFEVKGGIWAWAPAE